MLEMGRCERPETSGCPTEKPMKRDWQELPRGDVHSAMAGLHVTLNKKGFIVFNRMAYKKMGEPRAVLILFDRVNNRIGLKATSPSIRNAYPIAKYGRHGGRIVRAYRLLVEYGIDLPDTLEFPNAWIDEDEVLNLDLRTARISNRYLAAQRSVQRAEA